jgi:hypothetical protein
MLAIKCVTSPLPPMVKEEVAPRDEQHLIFSPRDEQHSIFSPNGNAPRD